nr:hypothetical protein [Tanacetum cinerariifolium]
GDGALDMTKLEDSETQLSHEAIQQLQTEATDDTVVKDDSESLTGKMEDVSESLIEDSESVDLDAKNKESQTVVMDHVLNVSDPDNNEANEGEEQLEAEATNDPKVKDDSESLIENHEFVVLDENTDDNK